jgi:uncharacterized protein (TIGR04255 family)
MIGDRVLGVACGRPYPKWAKFKETILDLMDKFARLGLKCEVERYSVKYVNVIQRDTLASQLKSLKLRLTLGDLEIEDEQLQLRLERKEGELLHIITILIGATGNGPDGQVVTGAAVDVDSIHAVPPTEINSFLSSLPDQLQSLRIENKRKFFSLLKPETIESMGPVYE